MWRRQIRANDVIFSIRGREWDIILMSSGAVRVLISRRRVP
jgi:hypothetical protein